jgi:hypothetical protein
MPLSHMAKIIVSIGLLVAWAFTAVAETTTFKNEGLKNEAVVRLTVEGKKVNGTFASSEYGEEPATQQRFTGQIIPTPRDKHGVYMQIRFDGDIPYSAPLGTKVLEWYLKIVDHRAHLFIPMQERSYEAKTPKWIISDVDLVPE